LIISYFSAVAAGSTLFKSDVVRCFSFCSAMGLKIKLMDQHQLLLHT
jgi:hypothetical protein